MKNISLNFGGVLSGREYGIILTLARMIRTTKYRDKKRHPLKAVCQENNLLRSPIPGFLGQIK